MDADRWRQISHLCHEAQALADEDRSAFLDSACGGDDALRHEVESLLRDRRTDSFLASPPAEALVDLIHPDAKPVHGVATPGTTLGGYRIERLLGRGGMGAVFLAYDTTLHRQVALKVMEGPADSETARARLLREARNAAALNHPNICTIHEVGDANGSAFIAMEYVEGRSLRDRLDQGPLPLEEAISYGVQAADALAYAHDRGVVHRDFKAANAIVTEAGRLKIVDFGLARRGDAPMADATTMRSLLPAGAAVGTPYAMAPEQVRGAPTDSRTDIWALGVLLYEMVTGAQPFTAATIPELFSSILRDPLAWVPDTVPVEMRALIERCLDKEPERRLQQAGEVREALEAIQMGTVPLWVSWHYQLSRHRRLASCTAALGIVAVLVAFNVSGVRDRLAGKPPEPAPIKLAVLPFENLTGDPEQEYFSDGLTQEMIAQLGRLHPGSLSVIARTSVMRYKQTKTPIDQIGRELGVDYVLEGGAQREAGRVHIAAELIKVVDQTQLWADTYEREMAGILALQSDVARSVAKALALTLLPAEQARLAKVRAVNPEAYDLYIKGSQQWAKLMPSDLDTAQQYFELALKKAPEYAPAYAGLALVWSSRQQMGYTSPIDAGPKAKAAALKAVECDDTNVDAHAALGNVLTWTDWNWAVGEREFRRAIELNPNAPDAHVYYSHLHNILGRPKEAMAEIDRALAIDPFNVIFRAFYEVDLLYARRWEDALADARGVLRTVPDNPVALNVAWLSLARLGRQTEATAAITAGMKAQYGNRAVTEALEQGFAQGGYRQAMRRGAEALAAYARAGTANVNPTDVANLYLEANEKTQALDWLEKGFEMHDPNLPYIGQPIYESLRAEPRYQNLLRRLNLPI